MLKEHPRAGGDSGVRVSDRREGEPGGRGPGQGVFVFETELAELAVCTSAGGSPAGGVPSCLHQFRVEFEFSQRIRSFRKGVWRPQFPLVERFFVTAVTRPLVGRLRPAALGALERACGRTTELMVVIGLLGCVVTPKAPEIFSFAASLPC